MQILAKSKKCNIAKSTRLCPRPTSTRWLNQGTWSPAEFWRIRYRLLQTCHVSHITATLRLSIPRTTGGPSRLPAWPRLLLEPLQRLHPTAAEELLAHCEAPQDFMALHRLGLTTGQGGVDPMATLLGGIRGQRGSKSRPNQVTRGVVWVVWARFCLRRRAT